MKAEIRADELLREFQRLSRRNDEGARAEEIADALGISTKLALKLIRSGIASGWVTVGRRSSTRVDGQPCKVPVYLIRNPERLKGSKSTKGGRG